jgi:hypothetical protein
MNAINNIGIIFTHFHRFRVVRSASGITLSAKHKVVVNTTGLLSSGKGIVLAVNSDTVKIANKMTRDVFLMFFS